MSFYPGAVVVVVVSAFTDVSFIAPHCIQDKSRPVLQCCRNTRSHILAKDTHPLAGWHKVGPEVHVNFVSIKSATEEFVSVFTLDKK